MSLLKRFFKPASQAVFEFDGQYFADKAGKLVRLENLNEISGAKKILTDYNNQAFSRVIYLESRPKYAELLAKKKIIDSGEFEDAIDLHVHKKQKLNELTKLYCTPVPASVMAQYTNETKVNEDSILYCGIHEALWSYVNHHHIKEAELFVFAHQKSFDILIASKQHVYFASRYNAFENDQESIQSIWEIIDSEINKINQDLSTGVSKATLFHSGMQSFVRQIISATLNKNAINLVVPQKTDYQHNLNILINGVLLKDFVGSFQQKLLFWSQTNTKKINSILLGISILLFSLSVYAAMQVRHIQSTIDINQAGMRSVALPTINLPEDLNRNISFYENIKNLNSKKQIVDLMQDLSNFSSDETIISSLKLVHKSPISIVELEGYIQSNFNDAFIAYQGMIAALQVKGYRIKNEKFDTSIDKSDFILQLEYN